MRLNLRSSFLSLIFGMSVISFVSAEPGKRTPGARRRERHQQQRIRQGVKSGELTHEEAQGLRKEQRDIRAEKRQMKSDGTVTKEEREKLREDLNKSSQDIYNEKHDSEKR